ncbi:unnamed protein product [Blepharisma stoltei]|uniref:CDC20/Fizzy WD40 domain-containing protein n=1 Tax=Blepharisma stoltei TaxID=1481888 RepID=A0AAU9J2W8_9CILI|nr:unnamed protein product [Blepharisma stoltei]
MQFTPKKSFDISSLRQNSSSSYKKNTKLTENSGGRFIPNRISSNLLNAFEKAGQENSGNVVTITEKAGAFSTLLDNQFFGSDKTNFDNSVSTNLFRYNSQSAQLRENKENQGFVPDIVNNEETSPTQRIVPKVPYKVLDAPQLLDDFYLNVVDWSSADTLTVGLNNSIYLWSPVTGAVSKLSTYQNDVVASLSWSPTGSHLAVGTTSGKVMLYDVERSNAVRTLPGHAGRVGALAWNGSLLSSGSRDKNILHRDLRSSSKFTAKLQGHKQEVCGLKWSFEGDQLASGGNDNKLVVWSAQSITPVAKFKEHTAAVKAIAWSPHQHGLLVSGGGTTDRTIRSWNTLLSQNVSCIDTQSQVCNLIFSKNSNELVSTHGYSQNQVVVWNYPTMQKIGVLTGHTSRVLYLTMSADSQTIVTGAGDETLRFWKVFPRPDFGQRSSSLLPAMSELR